LGRVAIVTGTSSGIGRAVGEELLRSGWHVVGVSRRPSSIEASGYLHVGHDLARPAGLVERLGSAVASLVGDQPVSRVALVNNAADPALLGKVADLDPASLARSFTVNVAAPVGLMGWVVRWAPVGAPLRIVNVSSGAGVRPYPGLAAYGSAKAALRMAGMVLGSEVDLEGASVGPARDVTILSYSPGPVDTPMQAEARSTPVETFPLLDTFLRWSEEGQLQSPAVPASEIRSYVESDGHPRFMECRSGEIERP